MNSMKRPHTLAAIVVATLLAGATITAYATENAQERRDALSPGRSGSVPGPLQGRRLSAAARPMRRAAGARAPPRR